MSATILTEIFSLPLPCTDRPISAADHPVEITRCRLRVGLGRWAVISPIRSIPDDENSMTVIFEIRIHSYKIFWEDLVALARGDSIHVEHCSMPNACDYFSGSIRLHWWLDDDLAEEIHPSPCYEFTPDTPLPSSMGFEDWMSIRFPYTCISKKHRHNWHYKKWIEEANTP